MNKLQRKKERKYWIKRCRGKHKGFQTTQFVHHYKMHIFTQPSQNKNGQHLIMHEHHGAQITHHKTKF
jgi:hypothetical protein